MSQPQQTPNHLPELSELEFSLMNDPKAVWDVVREAGSIICTGSYIYCSNHVKLIGEFNPQDVKRYKIVLHNTTDAADILLKKHKRGKLIKIELPRYLPVRQSNGVYPVTEPVYAALPLPSKTSKSRVEEYLNKLKNQ